MIPLFLLFIVLIALAGGALILLGLLRWITRPTQPTKEDTVPDTFRTIAFVILIILMFGVTSGILGAA